MDVTFQAPPGEPSYPTDHLLYGDDPLPGIVAVERFGLNGVRLYRREETAGLRLRRLSPPLAPG